MDIQHLVDRLEQILTESRRVPLTANLIVEEDRVFNIIDQMRVSIPEEVKRANRVEAEKERILAQAHEEADRIRELAKQEATELVRRDAIIVSSQQRADAILERARREADMIRSESDVYAMEVLAKLEEDLLRSLSVVRNGLRKLEAEQAPPAPEAVQAPESAEPGE
ncbi:MAG TPA: ATPase [Anaerolineae bacterium]|jgi:cell division septum initiation protein DivIVA|nr:ATPase [Anaerolineae bacterium]